MDVNHGRRRRSGGGTDSAVMLTRWFEPLKREISVLGLGAMVCSLERREQSFALLDAWRAAGGNLLDTAHLYGGGESERCIGAWLRERGCRDEMVILSKCAHHNPDRRRVTPEDILCDYRDSIARLGVESIDLYMLHRDDPEKPAGPIIAALNDLMRSGGVRAIGASNWRLERIEEANAWASERGLAGFQAVSNQFSLAVPQGEIWTGCVDSRHPPFPDWHAKSGVPLIAWSSLAKGFFSGRFRPDADLDEMVSRVFYSQENWTRLERARMLGNQTGYTAAQAALAWTLHQPFAVYPLIGPQNEAELAESLGALSLRLSREQVNWLDLQAASGSESGDPAGDELHAASEEQFRATMPPEAGVNLCDTPES